MCIMFAHVYKRLFKEQVEIDNRKISVKVVTIWIKDEFCTTNKNG